jgi:hypothetical protein
LSESVEERFSSKSQLLTELLVALHRRADAELVVASWNLPVELVAFSVDDLVEVFKVSSLSLFVSFVSFVSLSVSLSFD